MKIVHNDIKTYSAPSFFSIFSEYYATKKNWGRSENEIQDSQASLQNGISFFLWGEIISGEDNDK
jgi:hypothetical protein